MNSMGKGQGYGKGQGHGQGEGAGSRWTASDIVCWILVPTWVFGVPVMIGGVVMYFHWEMK